MSRLLIAGGGILAAVLVLAVVTVVVATARWDRATAALRDSMRSGSRAPAGLVAVDSTSAPPVVRRYLERAIPSGALRIRAAALVQEGEFRMSEGGAGWRPFSATHHVRAYPPGFLWDASIAMAPMVSVRVRDGYLDGVGMMKGALAAVLVVVEGKPTRELAEGALYRYLAEATWVPTRLLPGDGLAWEAMDDSTARATLRDGGVEVAVQFGFDADADITSIFVPERGREVDGVMVPTPWTGRFRGHEEVDGFRIPMEGEVAWVVGGREVPYWRGRLTQAAFELTR